jgi:parallel beta-helix repeat protein
VAHGRAQDVTTSQKGKTVTKMSSHQVSSRGKRWLAVSTFVAVVSLLHAPASAAIQFECGDVITGSIRLTNGLSGCQLQGLIVGADNITIDLDGKTISGNGLDNIGIDAGIDNSAGHTGVIIKGPRRRGGKIRGFEQGVLVQGGTTENRLQRFTVTGNVEGVRLESSANTVTKVKAVGNVEEGIVVFGGDGNVISRNPVKDNGDIGILLTDDADSNQVLNNSVTRNADEGIHLNGADSNTVSGNIASANGRPNNEDGIDLDASNANTIEFNAANGNGEDGLDLNDSHNNTFRSNSAKSNPEDGVDIGNSNGNTFESNNLSENGEEGVDHDAADGNTYQENSANDNGDDGINVDGAGNVLNQNVVKRNGHAVNDDVGLGIDATNDPTVSGAGNIATGNDDPAQCDPFVPLCG